MSWWVFGYGSLLWRQGFAFEQQRVGFIRGFERRFWQGSTDHRGVPGAPGRVVTLLPRDTAVTWGVAYRVPAADLQRVAAELDHREKGGYELVDVVVHTREGDRVDASTYVATARNSNYLGRAPLSAIADQIARSHGPSGANSEYVLRLAAALAALDVDDRHVSQLAELVAIRLAERSA